MPAVPTRSRRRPSWYRTLPVWLQWLLPFAIAAALILFLVLFVRHETYDVPQEASVSSPKAIEEQNQQAEVLVGQDQAPHVVALAGGIAPAAGIRRAVRAYMTKQIKLGTIDGPLTSARCTENAGGNAARQVFHCDVVAANVTYPFDGVVQPTARKIIYCKRDAPPVPSMNIPVSKRCT